MTEDSHGKFRVFSIDTMEYPKEIQGPDSPITTIEMLHPVGDQCISGTEDGKIYLFNLINGTYVSYNEHYDKI